MSPPSPSPAGQQLGKDLDLATIFKAAPNDTFIHPLLSRAYILEQNSDLLRTSETSPATPSQTQAASSPQAQAIGLPFGMNNNWQVTPKIALAAYAKALYGRTPEYEVQEGYFGGKPVYR